jgi:uncharacterized RDD family membrane protein YckC
MLVTYPVRFSRYAQDALESESPSVPVLSYVLTVLLPAIYCIAFGLAFSATPGKLALHLKIVDARHGLRPTFWQLFKRFFAYALSGVPFFLGFIWAGFDTRKQALHDMVAKTIVIRSREGERTNFSEGA